MARLLVRRTPGGSAVRYQPGDVITAKPDGWEWGRLEDIDVWVSEGRPAKDWPGNTVCVDVPGVPVSDFSLLLEQPADIKRLRGLSLDTLKATATPEEVYKIEVGGTVVRDRAAVLVLAVDRLSLAIPKVK